MLDSLTSVVARRTVLRGTGRALGLLAVAVGAIRPGDAGAKPSLPRTEHEEEPGSRGIALLQAWAAGELPRAPVPVTWAAAVPTLGAGFFYPPTWEVTEITDPNRADFSDGDPFGAQVVAPDGDAVVLMLNLIAGGPITAWDAAWAELQQMVGSSDYEPLADDRFPTGAAVPHALVAARAGTTIVAVHVSAMPESSGGRTYLYVNLVAAAEDTFDALTEEVFLPLLQNLVTGGPGDCDRDPDDDDDESDDCSTTDE